MKRVRNYSFDAKELLSKSEMHEIKAGDNTKPTYCGFCSTCVGCTTQCTSCTNCTLCTSTMADVIVFDEEQQQ